MEGIIVNFRRGRHLQSTNQMIVEVPGIDSKEKAAAMIGKTVVWKSPAKKEIKGKVAKEHGSRGALKVAFETGMPGQAVGQKVTID
ncbi:50S ribosomal protein L35ae [Candidatus Woesearchaeota archaeon]|nr:50S ribosomal protein L35ae [Candidatus Woesearchaeota archaeon]